PNTLAAYATDVRQFLEFSRLYLDKQELSDLQPEDLGRDVVRAFATDLYANKSARATTARKLSSLRRFVRYLRREGFITESADHFVRSPKLERKVPAHLTVDEMGRLLEVPDTSTPLGRRDRAILEL